MRRKSSCGAALVYSVAAEDLLHRVLAVGPCVEPGAQRAYARGDNIRTLRSKCPVLAAVPTFDVRHGVLYRASSTSFEHVQGVIRCRAHDEGMSKSDRLLAGLFGRRFPETARVCAGATSFPTTYCRRDCSVPRICGFFNSDTYQRNLERGGETSWTYRKRRQVCQPQSSGTHSGTQSSFRERCRERSAPRKQGEPALANHVVSARGRRTRATSHTRSSPVFLP